MMRNSIKKISMTCAILSMNSLIINAGLAPQEFSMSKNFFHPRPASANIAREMMMQPNFIHKNSDDWYADVAATIFFQHGWNENNVNQDFTDSHDGAVSALGAFAWWSGNNLMTVGTNTQASTASSTTLANIDAYQFGLGNLSLTSTAVTIELNPIIYQSGADFMLIFGNHANGSSFFAKIKAPLTSYTMNPQFLQADALPAVAYPAGALALGATAITAPALTMTQAFAGVLGDATSQGDYTPMQFGLINGIQSTGARFADIEMTAGYTFMNDQDDSFSFGLRASAPTGNKATGVFLLEPIVGRQNWGLGGYVGGHLKLWENNNDDTLYFKFMGDVMHLFTTNTMRSYDLLDNGPGSKYLLVANYKNNVYQNSIQNLINYTTLESESTFGVEADIAIAFNYSRKGFTIDAGYEFYGRSNEDLEITGNFADQAYAILGRQGIGFAADPTTNSYACQPGATINSSVASLTGTTVPDITVIATDTTIGNALNPNNRISLSDLNIEGAEQTSYLTSKVFSKIGYEWNCLDYMPFCGIMAEFEFSNSFNNALPQWAIVAIGGITF